MAAGPFAEFTAALCLKNAPVFATYFATATAASYTATHFAPFFRGLPSTITPEWQAATAEMNVNPITNYIKQHSSSSVTVRALLPQEQTLTQ